MARLNLADERSIWMGGGDRRGIQCRMHACEDSSFCLTSSIVRRNFSGFREEISGLHDALHHEEFLHDSRLFSSGDTRTKNFKSFSMISTQSTGAYACRGLARDKRNHDSLVDGETRVSLGASNSARCFASPMRPIVPRNRKHSTCLTSLAETLNNSPPQNPCIFHRFSEFSERVAIVGKSLRRQIDLPTFAIRFRDFFLPSVYRAKMHGSQQVASRDCARGQRGSILDSRVA